MVFFFFIIPLTYNAGVFQSMHQDCLIFRAGLWVSLWDCAARLGSVQFLVFEIMNDGSRFTLFSLFGPIEIKTFMTDWRFSVG